MSGSSSGAASLFPLRARSPRRLRLRAPAPAPCPSGSVPARSVPVAMPPRGCAAAGPLLLLVLLVLRACTARASEITFELPDNAKQCFYEEIAQGTKCTLEFQVAG